MSKPERARSLSTLVLSEFGLLLAIFFVATIVSPAQAATSCPSITTRINVPLPSAAGSMVVDDQCRYLYITNYALNRVEVFSLLTQHLEAPIQVGSGPYALDVSPDGRTLYVANYDGVSFSVVDTFQRRQVSEIPFPPAIPNSPERDRPFSVAVASNGTAYITTTWGWESGAGYLAKYDPATGTIGYVAQGQYDVNGIARAIPSGDRNIIVLLKMSSPPAQGAIITIYRVATNDFSFGTGLFAPAVNAAVDYSGTTVVAGQYVYDIGPRRLAGTEPGDTRTAGPTLAGTLPGASDDMAINADGTLGFLPDVTGIRVVDLKTFDYFSNTLESPDVRTINGPIVMAKDYSFLAAATDEPSLLLMPTKLPPKQPPISGTMVFSTTQTHDQSYMRFYNAGTAPGTVTVNLNDWQGVTLARWTSPEIAPNASVQYGINTMEAAATKPFTRPALYMATVETTMTGTYAHVVWRPSDGTITNLSTCNADSITVPTRLMNVHSSVLDYGYPSFVSVKNTGTATTAAVLGLYNARNGLRLGTYTTANLAGGTGVMLSMKEIETAARVIPDPNTNHYVIKMENQFTGYLEHLVDNLAPGVLVDMSPVCVFHGPQHGS